MKKIVSLVALIVCLFFVYQASVTFFKKSHEVEYTIKDEKYTFQVQEFLKDNKYYFKITEGAYNFYLKEDNQSNKMKQLIETIQVEEKAGIMCIYPKLKKGTAKTMLCSDGKKMYAYESGKNTLAGSELLQKIKKQSSNLPFLKQPEEKEEVNGQVTYYPTAMDENVVLWFYQGFSVYNRARSLFELTLSFDRYENTHSKLVGKYYITPLYTDNRLYEFSSIRVFDVTNNSKYDLNLETTLSNYTYINGVVDSKLYLFDKNTMQQVEINPKTKNVRVVASKSGDALYYNGKWENRNIYDFVKEKLTFIAFEDTELKYNYTYQSAYMDEDSYYFYDGKAFYQAYKDFLEVPILLFEAENIKDIQVVDGHIYYILGDTLYKYSPNLPRKRIMKYSEFEYNTSSLYDVYRK